MKTQVLGVQLRRGIAMEGEYLAATGIGAGWSCGEIGPGGGG